MKMEPTVSSETSAIRTQDAGELPKKEQITILIILVTTIMHKLHI